MLLHMHPVNPQARNVKMVIECLLDGGVIIYPTDTIYGLGCDIFQHKAVERICEECTELGLDVGPNRRAFVEGQANASRLLVVQQLPTA